MRIDKFLKNSRLIKRRIEFGNSSVTVRVIDIIESARKETAADMYEIIQ